MFPLFPEFTPLTLELREPYNDAVRPFPPYSDISFVTLQLWWNLHNELSVSTLNDNLVIDYRLPFDDANSGLSIIGKSKIDESIETVFDYLRSSGKNVCLVHVPEFVVQAIQRSDQYLIEEEPDYHEYLLDAEQWANLEGGEYKRLRKKVNHFSHNVGEGVELTSLDLSQTQIQEQLFESIVAWETKNSTHNDPTHTEHATLKKAMRDSSKLDIQNLALYINKKLHGVVLYHQPLGKEYYIIHHFKVNYETPHISHYLHHEMAKKAVANNVKRLNIEMDLGIENLKKHKLMYKPVDFLKKFRIQPSSN